jgi:TetR/AcrR family transcriptional regulator
MKSVRLKRERGEARSAGNRSRTDRKRTVTAPSDKTPRRQQRLENKRIAIFDAALELFARYGLHGTTVDQIAEAADVSKTNLFYYFPTKEDVYVAALQNLLTEWLAPMLALDVEGDPVKSLSDYIRRKMEFSRKYPEASRLFCIEIVQGAPLLGKELRTSLKRLVNEKAAVIQAWIDAGKIAPVDPYHLIFSIWSTTQHYADFSAQVHAILEKRLTDKAFFEEATLNVQRIILGGIKIRSS